MVSKNPKHTVGWAVNGEKKCDPLKPEPRLLMKLGSIVVHTEEMLSDKGHHFDLEALKPLLTDPEVEEWMLAMQKMALLPEKRTMTRGQL